MKKIIATFLMILFVNSLNSQNILQGKNWNLFINNDGTSHSLVINRNDTVDFIQGKKGGPAFYVSHRRLDEYYSVLQKDSIASWKKVDDKTYYAIIEDLKCSLTYRNVNDQLVLDVNIKNIGNTILQPFKAGLKLGINTYMDKYPDWLSAYFPTLLRNEKTHFWGYFMSPKRKILVITSPDPIASWSVDYNYSIPSGKEEKPYYWGQHRIEGVNIDLLNALPLPERCPQNLYQLTPGESRSWRIFITPIKDIREMKDVVIHNTEAGFWQLPQTSLAVGESIEMKICSKEKPIVYLDSKLLNIKECGKGIWALNYQAEKAGHFTFRSIVNNKISEAIITVRNSWDWYLQKARQEAIRCPQKASTHIESWYGYTSAFIAARYMPDLEIDSLHRKRFDYLYHLLHNKDIPQIIPNRVQNTSGTIDLLVLKYRAHKDIEDVVKASNLADWLIKYSQREDGAFKNYLSEDKKEKKGILYTSVLYMAKSMLDLAILEKELVKIDKSWNQKYKRHFQAAQKAVEHLVSMHGNIQTEGEQTYEDGMISCTALQIAYLALQEEITDPKVREKYLKEALHILEGHDCLTQLQIPDGRQRGGTLRFWESQYDVLMIPNFMNSPHGWSAWRAYATYYTYLLTGDERWLLESYNAAGAFAQLIDFKTGKLRWSFCANPFITAQKVADAHPTASLDSVTLYHLQPMDFRTNNFIVGEQYINMISDKMFFNTQDNDVHECFKFIGEAFLTNAFVVERPDGSFKGYNCKINKIDSRINIVLTEKLIDKIHFNLKNIEEVSIRYADRTIVRKIKPMSWVYLDEK